MTGKRALKRGEEGENKVASVLDSDASFHRLSDILPPLKEVGASCSRNLLTPA